MMIWIACLLIGSITCSPLQQGYGDAAAPTWRSKPPSAPGFFWDSKPEQGESDQTSDKPVGPPAPQEADSSADPGSYGGFPYAYSEEEAYSQSEGAGYGPSSAAPQSYGYDGSYGSPEVYSSQEAAYEPAYEAPQSTGYDGSYGSSDGAYAGAYSYGYASEPQEENWSSGSAAGYDAVEEAPEPVFSDVSDLDPVYSFSSRSSYQRGRAVFAQTRYTPGEPAVPPMPVARPVGKGKKQSSPAKAPSKGGYW